MVVRRTIADRAEQMGSLAHRIDESSWRWLSSGEPAERSGCPTPAALLLRNRLAHPPRLSHTLEEHARIKQQFVFRMREGGERRRNSGRAKRQRRRTLQPHLPTKHAPVGSAAARQSEEDLCRSRQRLCMLPSRCSSTSSLVQRQFDESPQRLLSTSLHAPR